MQVLGRQSGLLIVSRQTRRCHPRHRHRSHMPRPLPHRKGLRRAALLAGCPQGSRRAACMGLCRGLLELTGHEHIGNNRTRLLRQASMQSDCCQYGRRAQASTYGRRARLIHASCHGVLLAKTLKSLREASGLRIILDASVESCTPY
jgi:hypothetical protein